MKNECGFYKVVENPSIKVFRKKQSHSVSWMVQLSKDVYCQTWCPEFRSHMVEGENNSLRLPMNSVYKVCSEFTDSQTHTSVIAGL